MKKKSPFPVAVSPRERKFAKAYVEHNGNITKAAEVVGVSRQTGHRYMHNPALLAMLQDAYQRAGITDDRIARVISEAMNAEKRVLLPDGKGGVSVEFDPDHKTRLDAVKMASDLSVRATQIANGYDPDREVDDIDDTLETTEIMQRIVKITRRRA